MGGQWEVQLEKQAALQVRAQQAPSLVVLISRRGLPVLHDLSPFSPRLCCGDQKRSQDPSEYGVWAGLGWACQVKAGVGAWGLCLKKKSNVQGRCRPVGCDSDLLIKGKQGGLYVGVHMEERKALGKSGKEGKERRAR